MSAVGEDSDQLPSKIPLGLTTQHSMGNFEAYLSSSDTLQPSESDSSDNGVRMLCGLHGLMPHSAACPFAVRLAGYER